MNKILMFAGTVEGRRIAEYLNRHGIHIHVCTATEYGETLLPQGKNIRVTSKRMDADQMKAFIQEEQFDLVIDATHPYAVVVSQNIKKATKETQTEYLRILRENSSLPSNSCIFVDSVQEAAEYLANTTGNALITTGSKELHKYTIIPEYRERLYARVLSTASVAQECCELGFQGKNLICMQGPFGEELNYAMLKQVDAKYLVTKESGSAGGFEEKINAAIKAGVTAIVIGRPMEETGVSYDEGIKILKERLNLTSAPKITLLGIGMGSYETMTMECIRACESADILIGATRVIESLSHLQKPQFLSYKPDEIQEYIVRHPEYENVVIALSGDSGFYSGAKKLIDTLSQYDIQVLPGISSMAFLCARMKISWEDVKFVTTHGREENIIAAVKNNEKVFSLLGGKNTVKLLCDKLMEYGLDQVILSIGEQLSYENETITRGTPLQLRDREFGGLCAALIENSQAVQSVITHGLPDEAFIRGQVPMTKEEVRSISISKMRLTRNSIIYDIGAGTGSIGIEMALMAQDGMVYAVERNEEAVSLMIQNAKKLGADNYVPILGMAPDAMKTLPAPTHAFIGGSQGNLRDIIACLFDKNPAIRIVMNAISLETMVETMNCLKEMELDPVDIAQVSIAKSKTLGAYHMMFGQNPVYIIAFGGGVTG